MAQQPPIKTKTEDIEALTQYLKNQVGWTAVAAIKKAIPPAHADNRKLEAMRYVGLLERDQENVKLSDAGRKYAAAGSADERRG